MLSLLFSVTAVYCFTACRFWYIFTPLLLCASVGLYQAYYQVAVLLMIILLIKQMFEGESFQNLLRKSLISVGTLLLGLIVYYVLLQIVYQITGVVASDSYNGLTAIGNYADESIIIVFIKTYLHVAKSFILPETHNPILVATANVIIIISALLLTFIIAKKRVPDTKNKLLLILIIAFMPFGANVVHFIAKFEHSLMTFSFVLFYAFALLVSEEYLSERMLEKEHKKHPHVVQYATILLGTIVILNGLVFSNQAYFKKDLEYQATQLTMNRIMSRMESVEGYQVGRTPVVFIGRLDQSPYAKNRPGFEHLDALGLNNNIAVTYYKTYEWYLEQLAGYPLNLLPETEAREIATTQDVKGMPPYPEVGFCKIIDDTLVVKLSDGWHYTQSDVSM